METTTPLLTYQVRESRRARHFRLEVTAQGELLVVVPRGVGRQHIASLLEEKRAWIERAMRRVHEQAMQRDATPRMELPDRLDLSALGEEWAVQYVPIERGELREVREFAPDRLEVRADPGKPRECRHLLRRWLNRRAHERLIPWLERVSRDTGMAFSGVGIRAQRTRWGSCSHHARISLNERLLFLPPALVEYVLVHELCHTVHMSHAQKFWGLLTARLPACRSLQKALRDAWHCVPEWVERE